MKRIFTTILMAVGITGPFANHLAAQENPMVADIPFAFVVGNQTFAAGKYKVAELKSNSPAFLLTDERRHSIYMQLGTNTKGDPDKPSLTFVCFGKDCLLTKVTPADGPIAFGLSTDSIEKHQSHTLGVASMVSIKLRPR